MKKIILILTLIFSFGMYAQVGINETDPEGALDVKSTDSGLVIPRVANTAAVTNPSIANTTIAEGTMVYDISSSCIKAYEGGSWSDCFSAGGTAPTRTVKNITSDYTVLPNDDIIIYTGTGNAFLTMPTGVPLGKEYIIVNNESVGSGLLSLDTQATTTSINLSASAATTVIHIGGNEFAALHSF